MDLREFGHGGISTANKTYVNSQDFLFWREVMKILEITPQTGAL